MNWLERLFDRQIREITLNLDPSIEDLVDSADRLRAAEYIDPRSIEVARVFAAQRVKQRLAFASLSQTTGLEVGKLIDFEIGALPLSETCLVAEQLRAVIKIEDNKYRDLLLSAGKKR
jgi:hypothetical protein